MICAGYCAYGSATEMVVTYGHGVERHRDHAAHAVCVSDSITHTCMCRYTLDPSIGEFILTAEKMTVPAESKTIYSVNDGMLSCYVM